MAKKKTKKKKRISAGFIIAYLLIDILVFAAIAYFTNRPEAPQIDAELQDYKTAGLIELNTYYDENVPDEFIMRLSEDHRTEVQMLKDAGKSLIENATCKADVDIALSNYTDEVLIRFNAFYKSDVVEPSIAAFDTYYEQLLDEFTLYDESPPVIVENAYKSLRGELTDADISAYKTVDDSFLQGKKEELYQIFDAQWDYPSWTPIS